MKMAVELPANERTKQFWAYLQSGTWQRHAIYQTVTASIRYLPHNYTYETHLAPSPKKMVEVKTGHDHLLLAIFYLCTPFLA
jgi:hypothetical protein